MITYVSTAYAHRPYLKKDGYITYNSHSIIRERLYGDGIIAADPFVFQLRNKHGAVLARSPVTDRAATFCPSLELCYVFPYFTLSVFSYGWKLDTKTALQSLDKPNSYKFDRAEEQESFNSYMNNHDVKDARSYMFGYPEIRHSEPLAFEPILLTMFFSPLLILIDTGILLLLIVILTFFVFIFYWLIFRWKKPTSPIGKVTAGVLGTVILLGYLFGYVVILFLGILSLSLPVPYMLLAMYIGGLLGIRHLNRRNISKIKNLV